MKWILTVNQRQAKELGIKNINQALILSMICECHTWAEPIIVDGEVYYWASRTRIADELEMLELKDDTIYRHLKTLAELGLIEYKKSGKKDCVRLTKKGKTYYVGNESEKVKTTMSEMNPNNYENSEIDPKKLGFKSEKNSDSFPTYPDTRIIQETKNNSSSSSESKCVQEIEEEDDKNNLVIPSSLDSVPVQFIMGFIQDKASAPHVKNFARYQKSVLKKIKDGDEETITNILAEYSKSNTPQKLSKSDSRKLGELQSNISSIISVMEARNESIQSIIDEVRHIVEPYTSSFPMNEIESVLMHEFYKHGLIEQIDVSA